MVEKWSYYFCIYCSFTLVVGNFFPNLTNSQTPRSVYEPEPLEKNIMKEPEPLEKKSEAGADWKK